MAAEPIILTEDFRYALDKFENTNKSIFLTGRAGTGKSTLLGLFRKDTKKRVVVLAPTGVAALNVRGQTIHSFFGFPPRMLDHNNIPRRRKNLYQRVDTIVIDEVSMVRVDMLDAIDMFLRIHRERDEPFGGVQMIFIGDLFQLPPVVSSDDEKAILTQRYRSKYFFDAHVFQELQLNIIELQTIFRQTSREFIALLDNIRTAAYDYDDMRLLNERANDEFEEGTHFVTLCARNATVKRINSEKLDAIHSPMHSYVGVSTGNFNLKTSPADHQLQLKMGAQVMFIRNDPEGKYVNGSVGEVVMLDNDSISVMLNTPSGDLEVIEVQKVVWESIRYRPNSSDPSRIDAEVVGTFKQYPLKLAWAITIHKSQSKTFDKVLIELGKGAFEHGQTYVALSRSRTLHGIVLKQPIRPRDIIIDRRVLEFLGECF